jgi:hypothetical protein
MKLKATTVIISLLISFVVFSQNARWGGVVLDSLTKQALPQATITLQQTGAEPRVLSAIADKKGIFLFKQLPQAQYLFTIAYVGYRTFVKDSLFITASNASVDTFYLALANQALKSVTVTAQKPFIVQTADKIILNVAESAIAAGSNAYEVLLRAPGVVENNDVLQFRGKSVNIYIDGRPSNISSMELKNFLSNMPANGIEKVELIPNPSARYDALGGSVINIRLAKNKNFGTNGTLTQGIGTGKYARYNSGISLNNRTKKVNIYGSYDYQQNKQYFDNRSERILSSSASILETEFDVRTRNNHSFKLGVDYDINKNSSIGFLVRGYVNFRDRASNNRSVFDLANKTIDSLSIVQSNGYARFFSPSVNAYYKTKTDSAGSELTINADYLNYNKIWRDEIATNYYDEGGFAYRAPYLLRDNSPSNNSVSSLSVDYSRPIKKKAKMEIGFKSTFSVIDNDLLWQFQNNGNWKTDIDKTNRFIYKENINAAYITFSKTIKKYNVSAGLRAEQTNTNGQSVTLNTSQRSGYLNLFPNLAVQFASKKQYHQYNIAYRKSIQRYGFDYVNPFITYQSQYTYSQGNPYLQPQLNHSIEFSHNYKYKLFTSFNYLRSIKALAPVYKQSIDNLLISSYDNLGSSDVFILTLTSSKTIKKKWTSNNTVGAFYYNYQINGQAQKGNNTVTGYISSQNTVVLPKKWILEFSAYYFSRIASGIYKMDGMGSVSSGISKQVWKGLGNFKFNVSDIFNTTRYRNVVENYQGVNGVFINKPETRFVNLVFTYKFGNKNVRASKSRKTGIEDEKNRMGAN